MGTRYVNVLTARPSETAQMTQVLASVKPLGFDGIRFDVAFEEMFPNPTSTGVFTGFDNAINQAVANEIEKYWFSVSPFPSTSNAAWTAILGTYGSASRPIKKRPPAGAANAGWIAIADQCSYFEDHVAALFESLGIPLTNVHKQYTQEPGIGLADGPSETGGSYPALTDAEAAGYTGIWDDDATWDAIATASGKAAYADVRGLHDFLNFIVPRINSNGSYWAMPSIGGEVSASIEVPSALAGGAWIDTIEAANGGSLEMAAHIYPGDFVRRSLSSRSYARRAVAKLVSIMNQARAERPGSVMRWHVPEIGALPSWIFGTTSNSNAEYKEQTLGLYWGEMLEQVGRFCDVIAFEELALDPTTQSGTFYLIDTGGDTIRAAAKWVGKANGASVDASGAAPSWDNSLSWAKPAAEAIPVPL